jgi:transposase
LNILTGRPPVLTEGQRESIRKFSAKYPFATARTIKKELCLLCSLSTVRLVLKKSGLRAYRAKQQQLIRPKNVQDRLNFARQRLAMDWSNVIFSDEKTMQNFHNGIVWVRRPKGTGWEDKYLFKHDKSRRFKINVWGYIGLHSCGLFNITIKHDASSYINVLKKFFLPRVAKQPYCFMQDNASIHKAKTVTKFLKDEKLDVLEWPAQSPDLNPIENVWANMQREVYLWMQKGKIKNAKQLFQVCHHCFKKAWRKDRKKLFASMQRRMQAVVDLNGQRTKY